MKVSLNWVRKIDSEYQSSAEPAPDGVDKLVDKIGAQLGAVEEVIDLGKKYEGIVVAKVVSCEKHPDADKLSLCMIDDGGAVKNVERIYDSQDPRAGAVSVPERAAEEAVRDGTATEQRSSEAENAPQSGSVVSSAGEQAGRSRGLVQVVCGAPNVAAGQLVAWIPPGVTVPATANKDPFVLEAREIRGKVSNGMLASPKELALSDNHDGILVIDEDVKPGQQFADVYSLNDFIIDIENKMFTHRPDLFGQLGVAREIAGIQQHVFKSPDWYRPDAEIPAPKNGQLELSVDNQLPELVPRFLMLPMSSVAVKPSPVWLQTYLSRVGIRPINSIVDITNYLMMETAQPLHAYDYDKVKAFSAGDKARIIVRMSKEGEEITVLGGKSIKLKNGVVVIATDQKAIGLGGVMGGAGTEVDENTKNIIIEVGTFDMNTTRKTAMTYGLFTDAATRFTKGQSPLQNQPVMAHAAGMINDLSGGHIAGELADIKKGLSKTDSVNVSVGFINDRLGISLLSGEVKSLLENVEFSVNESDGNLSIQVPFWRTDIEIPEDIVEEVGRLYGYDHLPLELPKRDLTPARKDESLELKSQVREALTRAGANEILTYSFVHGRLIDIAGQDKQMAFHIRNALSPDLQYYRLSLMPSLLEKIHPNIKLGFDHFALFEIGKAHSKTELDEDGLPKEFDRVALVLAANKKAAEADYPGAAYYWAKKQADYLFKEFAQQVGYKPLEGASLEGHELTQQMVAPFEPKHSAGVYIGDKLVGVVGEYKASVTQALKLPAFCAGIELFFSAMQNTSSSKYQPLNRFPNLDQDLCLRLPIKTTYQEATSLLLEILEQAQKQHSYKYKLTPIDIFQRPEDKDHKQITWRIIISHPQRTLTADEANKLLDEIAATAKQKLDAERI